MAHVRLVVGHPLVEKSSRQQVQVPPVIAWRIRDVPRILKFLWIKIEGGKIIFPWRLNRCRLRRPSSTTCSGETPAFTFQVNRPLVSAAADQDRSPTGCRSRSGSCGTQYFDEVSSGCRLCVAAA